MTDNGRSKEIGRITLGGDKGYDTREFGRPAALNITPHVAQNEARPGDDAVESEPLSE